MTETNYRNVSELLDLLEEVEWTRSEGATTHRCPVCDAFKELTVTPMHYPSCRLQAALVSWGRRPAPTPPRPEKVAQKDAQGLTEAQQRGRRRRRFKALSSEECMQGTNEYIRRWLEEGK